MKKIAYSIIGLAFLALGSLKAEDVLYQQIGPFEGLNNSDNSLVIGSGQAQDLLNVDITPGGKSVVKRKGYAQAFQLTNSSMPAHGTHYFYNSSGDDVALYFNDSYGYASVSGSSPTTLISTGPVSATYQCVDSQGFAYCVNTSRSWILKTNGLTISFINPPSTGTILAVTPTRLVMAGFSSSSNRVDFSQANDFTNWTPGGLSYSPVNFTVTAPGSKITHLAYAHERLYWFKQTSFGYIMEGPTLADWTMRTISNDIGTNDNTSVYRDGILYFKGSDSEIYSYDGANLSDLTREIGSTVGTSQSRGTGLWSQSSKEDFENGSLSSLDSTTVGGQLSLVLSSTYTVSNRDSGSFGESIWKMGKTWVPLKGAKITGASFYELGNYYAGNIDVSIRADLSSTIGGVLVSSIIYVTKGSAKWWDVTFPYSINVSSDTTYWIYVDALDYKSSPINCPQTNLDASADPTSYQCDLFGSCGYGTKAFLYRIYGSTYSLTGTYQSAVKNAPAITSWDSFIASDLYSLGNHSYSIRSATGNFSVNSSTPSWTSISNGQIPTVTVNQYFQIKDVITTTNTAYSPILYSITQNWFEGNAEDKSYASYYNDAILWSVTSGTGATKNNKILRYDLVNPNTWTIYNIPTNGMYVKNKSLYFVGASTGVVYKFGDVDNDNGSAINAYWKSKDFIGVSPFQDNEYVNLSLSAAMVANSSMTVTYTINGSSNTSYTMPLKLGNKTFTSFNKYLPAGRTGTFFNLQFGNNSADQPFEVFGAQFGYRPKPWAVSVP